MNRLYVTVGLPRSGKTTWARKQGLPIVNPDAIRLAVHGHRFIPTAERLVWATAHAMVDALFLAGHEAVILDATNITRKRRDEWLSTEWFVTFVEFHTTPGICIERAWAANDSEIIPIIETQGRQREAITDEELYGTTSVRDVPVAIGPDYLAVLDDFAHAAHAVLEGDSHVGTTPEMVAANRQRLAVLAGKYDRPVTAR